MAKKPHTSARDEMIRVVVIKPVNQLRPSDVEISVEDNSHNRALIRSGYFRIVQGETLTEPIVDVAVETVDDILVDASLTTDPED